MSKEINCEKIFIKDIFLRWYRIPEYQRPYIWERDQVLELFEDIMGAYQSNAESQYFLGSMVLKINEKSDGSITYKEYELLDGQQRITTIFLSLAVIRDMVDRTLYWQIYEGCMKDIFQKEDIYNDQPERIRIVFDIRDDVRTFVNEYIKIEGGTNREEDLSELALDTSVNVSVRNMAKAILTLRAYFAENMHHIAGFYKFFRTKVLMIYVATEELEDAFQLFTVLNNRGVKLSNSDILKAINLKEVSVPEERTEWARRWEEMESYFGEDFDKFLSHIRTILVKSKATVNLLKEFEDNVYAPTAFDRTTKQYYQRTPLLQKGKNTFLYMDKIYRLYMEIFDKDHYEVCGDYEISNYLNFMWIGLGSDYWIAPVLDYYSRFKTKYFAEFIKALDRKVSADWITSKSPTIRIENVNGILKEIEKSKSAEEVLKSDAFNIDEKEFEDVLDKGVYGKRYAKYLLLKLDLLFQGHTTKFSPPPTISIEHILPQNPSVGSRWVNDFTEEERTEWTDKIGNLVLISRRKNSSQGNLEFPLKMTKYFESNIELFSNSIRIFKQYKTWKLSDLKDNQRIVIKKIMEEYKQL